MTWIEVCNAADIPKGDVTRFDHEGRTFAVYRTDSDKYYATEGLCTHGKIHLSGGLVMDNIIECPKHNGRFDFTTGQAKGAPVCKNLQTFPVKADAGRIYLQID